MAAKDYKICPALFNAYIAKVSKRDHNLMTDDRRVITDQEIVMLMDWWLDKNAEEGEHGMQFDSYTREGMKIEMRFKKKDDSDDIEDDQRLDMED